MNHIEPPTRAIINFTKKCALSCEWCYVPFGSQSISKDLLSSVVKRLGDLGFDSVTFGGGDPFQFKHLESIIKEAKEIGLFVHVDTHAITLLENQKNASLLESYVDLLGLPLDGSNGEVHDLMRGAIGHHKLIMSRLDWLREYRISIKINTIVSSVNVSDMRGLGKLISSLNPDRWSIYQYWPVGPAKKAASENAIDVNQFRESIRTLNLKEFNNTVIEVNTAESRRKTYPILNHLGEVYVHHEYPVDDFEFVGQIFDADISDKISALCGQERREAVARYISTNKRVN